MFQTKKPFRIVTTETEVIFSESRAHRNTWALDEYFLVSNSPVLDGADLEKQLRRLQPLPDTVSQNLQSEKGSFPK